MKKIVSDKDLKDDDKLILSFALGKSLEDLKKYDDHLIIYKQPII